MGGWGGMSGWGGWGSGWDTNPLISLAMPGPSSVAPTTPSVTPEPPKDVGYKELKKTIGTLSAFIRDYPKLQTKMWANKRGTDAKLASDLFRKATDLLSVVATGSPPTGQILDPKGRAVIGFINPSGSVVPAPMLPVLPGVPLAISNNHHNYKQLLRGAINFTHQYVAAKSKFKKTRKI